MNDKDKAMIQGVTDNASNANTPTKYIEEGALRGVLR